MNSDLTIILLLKGRDAFTMRWFEYAKKFKIPYKIIVADGGLDTDLEKELRNKKFYPEVDYEYVRYPYDENYKIFYAKVLDALTRVETPYVILASNDDFLFFDALEDSVSFLKENSDYVSSRGEIWDFAVSSPSAGLGGIDCSAIYGNLNGVSKLYYHPTVAGESATERVIDFSLKSHSGWHDVVRTESLKEAYSALIESNINHISLSDSLVSFFLASQGKLRRGSELYMLHQCHSEMSALSDLHNSPFEWIDSNDWKSDLNGFLKGMAGQISKVDKISIHEAECKLMECYFVNIVIKTMIRDHCSQITSNALQRPIKSALVTVIKNLLRKNRFIFKLSKKLALIFLGRVAIEQVPYHFNKKLEDVGKFLENISPAASGQNGP
jgi:glycosyltransferase domain-containing protein